VSTIEKKDKLLDLKRAENASSVLSHTVNLFGIDVHALRIREVLDIANEFIACRRRLVIGVVNVAKVVNFRK
jgi:UDP-N-acetyl-D-mannosaminuronic acid transferase (WecB/TagA/CpsF family)